MPIKLTYNLIKRMVRMIRLKELRANIKATKGKKVSQQDLAKALNVSRSTVSMWETGASDPDTDSLQKIASYFSVSVDYLLGYNIMEENKKLSTVTEDVGFDIVDTEYKFILQVRQLDERDRGYVEGQVATLLLAEKYRK